MSLWAHTIVRNEERYIWYAIESVVNFVDKILLWDTGSTDATLDIIGDLQKRHPSKILFREMGSVNPDQFTVVRQKMLDESKCDWIIIVDGDEVWWDDKIKELRAVIDTKGNGLDSIVSKYFNIVGDVFHYQEESAGRYSIDGKTGNFNIRAFNRKIKGIKFTRPHGQQALIDSKNIFIQNRDSDKKYWIEGYSYLHFTNMQRSLRRSEDLKVPKRDFKYKFEIGEEFPSDFYYPEVFFKDRPEIVPVVWKNANRVYYMKSLIQTPLKKIKRKYFSSYKSGY